MDEPLRPELYNRLQSRFGGVVVVHPGEAMVASIEDDPDSYSGKSLNVVQAGEYYRVSCPFCTDTRGRLWINHMWGFYNPKTRSRNLWLAVCYNNDNDVGCLARPGRARELYDLVFQDVVNNRIPDDVVRRGSRPIRVLKEVEMPGLEEYPLHQLSEAHPAVRYVRSRGYDHLWLGREKGLSYCEAARPEFPLVNRRLVIPVHMFGRLVGWQARHLGEPPEGVPKYWTMPGMKKSQVLYNYDKARESPFVVVTEGPTKVWSVGEMAVATLGDTISSFQVQLLTTWKTVVIYLDGKAIRKAEELYQELGRCPEVARVLVRLPPDKEPGDYTTEENRRIIMSEAARQGIRLL